MSKITYQYIDPPRSPEEAITFMKDTLTPLLHEYWEARGKDIYKIKMSFNILSFIQMWNMGGLLIIIAYEDKKPVGFFIGVRFTPFLYNARALQVELFYAPNDAIESGMFTYLMNIIKFMDINEVLVSSTVAKRMPITWPERVTFTVTHYIKE